MSLHFKRLPQPVCYAREAVECLDDNVASEFVSGSLVGTALTRVEAHLASCRDCRALVAALAGSDDGDSNAKTHQHERVTESQAGKRPTRTFTVGDRVGRYLVLSTLGAGGMGIVFSAYDPQLDRKVALKLLRANLGVHAKEARARLKREAQAIAQLSHPNVVGVYDVGATDEGDVYIAMEFVEGDTLTHWLRAWPRSWREILDVFHQAARGLMAAHSVGLLHRDFKPDNVLVGADGRVRVTDFGLARSVLGPDEAVRTGPAGSPLHVDLTATGTVLGTPRYMPPEQLEGPNIDARSDQFSFCVALYEALYATHPLPGGTAVGMLEHGERALAPPEGTRVPAPIGRAVLRGLEKERAKRFPTMAVLVAELAPPPRRSPLRVVALALAGVVVAGAAAAAVVLTRRPTRQVVPNDEAAIQPYVAEIQRLETETKQLRDQLVKSQTDLTQMAAMKAELDQKDQQIHELVDKVTELRAREEQLAHGVVPARIQSAQVVAAVQGAESDVLGCMHEWSDREPDQDARMLVTLSVGPDGAGSDAAATGIESPSLRLCVADALARLHYPRGPQVLDLEVDVAWSGGALAMSGRVTGYHDAPQGTLDDL